MMFRILLTQLTFPRGAKRMVNLANAFCTKPSSASASTIFALSSGHGRCGVAVIRVSGPSCKEAVQSLCRQKTLPAARQAVLKRLFDPVSREMIDKGLVLWFPGPSSFTGEDCAEFHVHGGSAVVSAMLETLGTLPGLRPAEPGDFTRRAFLSGKMDLTEVEGLGDLIHAETSAQRRQAVRQMEGDLGNVYAAWRRRILKCLADVEAFIDFSEDENIEEDTLVRAKAEIERVCEELQNHLSDNRQGERLRDGVHVAIIGEPNVGKSSLLNALCQRPAAIVSPMAGTTRDVVETAINLGGFPVLLSDTAGLRETSDFVEKEGVRRALDRASKADLKVLVLDASTLVHTKLSAVSWSQFVYHHMASLGIGTNSCDHTDDNKFPETGQPSSSSRSDRPLDTSFSDITQSYAVLSNTDALRSQIGGSLSRLYQSVLGKVEVVSDEVSDSRVCNTQILNKSTVPKAENMNTSRPLVLDEKVDISDGVIVAVNKSDLVPAEKKSLLPKSEDLSAPVCCLSCTTTDGLDSFVSLLAERVKYLCGDPLAGSPSLTQARHRTHLTQCLRHLTSYLEQVNHCDSDIVLAAQALRRAMRELGRVTGAVNVEDILDVIFKDFCIGK
ncbi:tRNA modification GTPase GTPBP3, mitochondrial-like [Littorina saxatilis]|uniref:tRNA modification GTPase GTPBP3, mitochondrial n=1 Tax=Littorina saxatilis TaxID=31220 RepID=A0AAN9C1K0_9CAEN